MADRSRRREEAEVFTEMRGLVFRLLTSAATLSFALAFVSLHWTECSTFCGGGITFCRFKSCLCRGFTTFYPPRWMKGNPSRWELSLESRAPARRRRAPRHCSTPTDGFKPC